MIAHPNRKRRATTAAVASLSHRPRAAASPTSRRHADHDYGGLLVAVRRAFDNACLRDGPLFLTDADDLNEVYLDNLPSQRQFHNCSCCRRFINTYGSLATIDEAGRLVSAMWDPDLAPDFYRPAFAAMAEAVRSAGVDAVFVTDKSPWGTGITEGWSHFAVMPPASVVRSKRPYALTPSQEMAAARENVKTVFGAMAEYSPKVLDEALRVLEGGHVDRAEKFVAPVRWLRKLHDSPKGRANVRVRNNILWRAVATAPEGFCHIKSSVVGPLLDDIVAGVPFDDLRRKHAAKVQPTVYQRPQAAPSAGNAAAAEALFDKLGLAPALERRFARLSDIGTNAVWWSGPPKAEPTVTGKVFGHVKTKGDFVPPPETSLPVTTMTWRKFSAEVLAITARLQLKVPNYGRFSALTTAVHPGAPPILKWDRDEARNTVSWYTYASTMPASQWGLKGGAWATVNAVVPLPNLWGDRPMPFLFDGVFLILDGAMDSREAGNALFPEVLRDDLYTVRSTIEAYSRSAKLHGREEGSACAYDVRSNFADCHLRALVRGGWAEYKIDRWD